MTKTALKEFIDNVIPMHVAVLYETQQAIKKGLEKEKQQIIEARENGLMDGVADYVLTEWGKDSEILTSEEYYKQKYKIPPCSGHAYETE